MKIVTNCDAIREFRMIYFYRRRCMFPPILLIHFRSSQHTFVSLTMTLFLLMPFVMLDFVTIVPSHLLIHCSYYLDHGLVFVYRYWYHPSSWWLKLFQVIYQLRRRCVQNKQKSMIVYYCWMFQVLPVLQ